MKIETIRIVGIRCFEDTGKLTMSPGINVFVGENNVGKSTILKSILAFQSFPLSGDERPGSTNCYHEMSVHLGPMTKLKGNVHTNNHHARFVGLFRGEVGGESSNGLTANLIRPEGVFFNQRPDHELVPFLAKRKGMGFDQTVNLEAQNRITGTLHNLYSRIDRVLLCDIPCVYG